MSLDTPAAPSSARTRSVSPDSRPALARSFSRLDPVESHADPLAASLERLQTDPNNIPETTSPVSELLEADDDASDAGTPGSFPDELDGLPPELINLTDRFIDSLTSQKFTAPVHVDKLKDMFQSFYTSASHTVSEYVSSSYLSLSSRKGRSSAALARKPTQMLSLSEIEQKKKDRKLVELRKLALEEAVERRVTEAVYERIWRHKSTDDEARDDALFSKMAALRVVGVTLKHLMPEISKEGEKPPDIDAELQPAVEALVEMDSYKFPLGKLAALKRAHKIIVECLATHLTSASADSLLPTLIYTLLLTPSSANPAIISNLYFIQRFRSAVKLDGEASYCLVGLEAAITFLETVDLATLNIPVASSRSPRPQTPPPREKPSMPVPDPLANLSEKLTVAKLGENESAVSSTTSLTLSAPGGDLNRTRSGSRILMTPLDLASTAVSTANQGLQDITTTLDTSFKFLFGKLEKQGEEAPKTLEDARKLVSPDSPRPSSGGLHIPPEIAEAGHLIRQKLSRGSLRSDSATPVVGLGLEDKKGPAPPVRAVTTPIANAAQGFGEGFTAFGNSLGRFASRPFIKTTAAEQSSAHASLESLGMRGPGREREMVGKPASRPGTAGKVAVDARWEEGEAEDLRVGEVALLLAEYRRLVRELRKRDLVAE